MRSNRRLWTSPAFLGLYVALLVGVAYSPELAALCGEAELDCVSHKLKQVHHPELVDCIAGASPSCLSHSATGTVTRTLTNAGNVSGTGTANYLPKWTDATTLGVSGVYEGTDYRLGVGITNPAGQIGVVNQVAGGAPQTYAASSTAAGQSILNSYYGSTLGGEPRLYSRFLDIAAVGTPDGTYGDSIIRFLVNPITLNAPSVEAMRVASSGVTVAGVDPRYNIFASSSSSAPGYVMYNSGGQIGSLFIGGSASPYPDTVGFYFNTSQFSFLNGSGTSVLSMKGTGEVSVGTATSTSKLTVDGAIVAAKAKIGTDTFTDTLTNDQITVYANADHGIKVVGSTRPRVLIKSTDSDSPGTIDFYSPSNAWSLKQYLDGFYISGGGWTGGQPLYFNASSQAGIGHTPGDALAATLDVNGSLKATNEIAVAGGHWVYRTATGTDSGTSTAGSLAYLRAGTATLSMTATGTYTATATGTSTFGVTMPSGYVKTWTTWATNTMVATDAGTSIVQPYVIPISDAASTLDDWVSDSVLQLPYATKTLTGTQAITQTDFATTTPTASKVPLADGVGKLANGWLDLATASATSKIVQARTDGTIDVSWLPTGVNTSTATYTTLGSGTSTISSTGTQVDLGTVTGPAKAGYYKVSYDLTGNIAGSASHSCEFHVGLTGCSSGSFATRRVNATEGAGYFFSVAGSARYQLVSDSACTVHVYMNTENNGLYCVFDAGALWLEWAGPQ